MIYLTLQSVLKETMKVRGCNKFKIPHMKKGTLEKERPAAIANFL